MPIDVSTSTATAANTHWYLSRCNNSNNNERGEGEVNKSDCQLLFMPVAAVLILQIYKKIAGRGFSDLDSLKVKNQQGRRGE